jgi:sterol 24-C-methyltransferase
MVSSHSSSCVCPFPNNELGYYDGATELYEYGWANSFHFSRFYKGEAFSQSLARHEHFLAAKMGLKPGMRVLDVGCGVGGPAREIAQFTDCNIVGVNNNEFQVGRARNYTKKINLQDQVTFVKGDFMNLVAQFGENSFDAGMLLRFLSNSPILTLFQFMPSRPLAMHPLGRAYMEKSRRSLSLEEL